MLKKGSTSIREFLRSFSGNFFDVKARWSSSGAKRVIMVAIEERREDEKMPVSNSCLSGKGPLIVDHPTHLIFFCNFCFIVGIGKV